MPTNQQPTHAGNGTPLQITDSAIAEIKRLMAQETEKGLFLRIGVSSGGCSGMSYQMSFDNRPGDNDRVYDFDGLEVRVDEKVLPYLTGAEVDYASGLMGAGFKFSNPNARRSCGCGSSFSC